jgi:hypothetical protein
MKRVFSAVFAVFFEADFLQRVYFIAARDVIVIFTHRTHHRQY